MQPSSQPQQPIKTRIWIEYEFATLNQQQSIEEMKDKYEITDLNQFINIPDSNIKFALDKEYYDSIYEIKTYPSPNFTTNIHKIQGFIRENISQSLYIQNPWPDYTWTHIHIFKDFEKKKPSTVTPDHRWSIHNHNQFYDWFYTQPVCKSYNKSTRTQSLDEIK